jgi:hypothetical protein
MTVRPRAIELRLPERHALRLAMIPVATTRLVGLGIPTWLAHPRILRIAAIGATVVILGVGLALFQRSASGGLSAFVGTDINQYLRATQRWIETGTPYLASDVAGPVIHGSATFLHPPVSLYLFAPFLVLPLILWWAIPIGVVFWSVWSWRPAWWSWPFLALALAWPRFHGALLVGNTDLWVCAGVALGLRFGWPALVVAVKPSLLPLMLAGVRHRSWWVGAAVVALACAPFALLWVDWFRVMLNGPGNLAYSLPNVVWVAMPAVAWLARTRAPSG